MQFAAVLRPAVCGRCLRGKSMQYMFRGTLLGTVWRGCWYL